MDLKSLTYFVTVAEELNITKAAERLNMSQPPLSNQIKNLEDELNTVLFVRGKRHLKLTESGKLLYRRAKEILSLTDKAEHEIISMSKGMNGTISIGLVEGSAPSIAAEWIASFIKLHPEVKFRIMDGNSDELIGKLRSGLISLAVITAPYDQTLLNGFNVGKERMVAFMSKEHPLSKIEGSEINLSDLKNENLIVPSRKAIIDMLYKWFKEVKSEPKIVCEMDNYLDVAALAGRNIGVSIFPQTASVGNTSIITKNIVNPERYIDYIFVWRKGNPLPTSEEAFIDHVRESIQ